MQMAVVLYQYLFLLRRQLISNKADLNLTYFSCDIKNTFVSFFCTCMIVKNDV